MSLKNQMMKFQVPGSLPVCTFLHVLNYLFIVLVDCYLVDSQYSLVVSVEYFKGSKFLAQNFFSFNFLILTMVMVSCCFAHSFKIMHIPQPIILYRAPPQPVIILRSGRDNLIEVPYIRCLNGRVLKTF